MALVRMEVESVRRLRPTHADLPRRWDMVIAADPGFNALPAAEAAVGLLAIGNGMEEADLIAEVERLLGPNRESPGILDRHGRVMMSGWDTIAPSRYYVLFINPGGKEVNPPPQGESVRDSLHERERGWNYFRDKLDSRIRLPYEKAMAGLGAGPSVPVSNALFLRSSQVGNFPNDASQVFARHCAPVHQLLLREVQPSVVVCFGLQAWKLMTGRGDPGHWRFHPDVSFKPAGLDYRGGVLLLPHYARGGREAWRDNEQILEGAIRDARTADR